MTTTFSSVLARLRGVCPPDLPVTVRRKKVADSDDGWCSKRGDRYRIVINSAATEERQIEVLLHEWAHSLAWSFESELEPHHGPHWGIAYARCYHAVYDLKI